jgi:hypothetical protein
MTTQSLSLEQQVHVAKWSEALGLLGRETLCGFKPGSLLQLPNVTAYRSQVTCEDCRKIIDARTASQLKIARALFKRYDAWEVVEMIAAWCGTLRGV